MNVAAFAIDLVAVALFIRLVYLDDRNDRDYAFLLVATNLVILVVGLFVARIDPAIWFSAAVVIIAGYIGGQSLRTSSRDLVYLLMATTLGLINGLAPSQGSLAYVALANLFLVGSAFALVNIVFSDRSRSCVITYDNVENIHRNRRAELYWDLADRLGLDVVDVAIESVDLHRGTATLRVRHHVSDSFTARAKTALAAQPATGNTIDDET